MNGKSPVEYLDARGQALARAFAREAPRRDPADWNDFLSILGEAMRCSP